MKAPETTAGKRVKCPKCGGALLVPSLPEPAPVPASFYFGDAPAPPVRSEQLLPAEARPPEPSEPLREATGFRCPFCGSRGSPIMKDKVSTVGWVIFWGMLLFVVCFPLCVIGLFFRDRYASCASCGMRIGNR